MSDGFDQARAQRSWLERLGDKIPGYRGFQDRELRRDVDKQQREYLAAELGRVKGALKDKARQLSEKGALDALAVAERADRKLDGLAQAIRFADYGATGLFDVDKIRDPGLEKLYEFDLEFVDEVARLKDDVTAIPVADAAAAATALEELASHLGAVQERWATRATLLRTVVTIARQHTP